MKKVLIVLNGRKNPAGFVRELSKKADFVIGVDGGAEFLFRNSIRFNLAIGDFDSVSDRNILSVFAKKGIETIIYPKEKDFSDAELGVRFALKRGFTDFILTNATGNRTDHLLFNISVMLFLLKNGKSCKILEEKEEIYITNGTLLLKNKIGYTASVYPITQTALISNSCGFKYSLENVRIKKYSSLSLSNVILKNEASIEVKSGTVLLITERIA